MENASHTNVIIKDICLPLTVGYHVEQSPADTSRPIKRQDGFISGWVFLTLLMAIAATMSLGHWLTSYWSKSIDSPTVQICGGMLQLVCCVLMLPILCNKSVRRRVSQSYQETNRTSRTPTSCRQWTKKVLPIIGITIFLTGMITLDIIKMAAYSLCIDAYQYFEEYPYLIKQAVVAIIYHPIRILFTSMVTVLCYMYIRNELCFYRYTYLRYMLLLVLAGVAWIWVDTQVTESLEGQVVEDAYSTGMYKRQCPPNSTMAHLLNYTQLQCLCRTTDTFQHVKQASEILYSFVVEFCLLVIECITHMLFSMADDNNTTSQHDDDRQGNHGNNSSIDNTGRNSQEHRAAGEGTEQAAAEEESPLLRRNIPANNYDEPYRYHMQNVAWMDSYQDRRTESSQHSYSAIGDEDESHQSLVENPFPSNRLTYFFVALVLGLAFVILTSMQTFSGVDDGQTFKVTYYTFKLCYHVLAIAITIQGFKSCQTFRSKHKGYMGFEMLTLFTSFGFFVYVFFILQANIADLRGAVSSSPAVPKVPVPHTYVPALIVYMVDIIMNVIQVYSQSLFMLHSSKIQPPADRSRSSREAVYLFKQVLLYLATCNLFIWGLESFVELQKISEILPFHSVYYGEANWQIMSHLAYPLMIFYRFNSCVYLVGIHLSI